MRSIKLAMIALFAIFAFGTIAVASASAFPEFKSAAGNLEFSGTSGTSTVRGADAGITGTITCEKDTSSGLIEAGTMSIKKVVVSLLGKCFQKLGSNGGTCTEPIQTKLLLGSLGLQSGTSKKVVLLLSPESGNEFLKISCTNGNTVLEGAVIGEFPEMVGTTNQYNKSLKSFTLEFKATNITQNIQTILLLPTEMMKIHLIASGFFSSEASLETTETMNIGGGEIAT